MVLCTCFRCVVCVEMIVVAVFGGGGLPVCCTVLHTHALVSVYTHTHTPASSTAHIPDPYPTHQHPTSHTSHQGRTFICKQLDLGSKVALVRPADVKYYTKTVDYVDVFVTGGNVAFPAEVCVWGRGGWCVCGVI